MTSLVTPTSQRTLVDNNLVLNPFKSWLVNKNYSSSTIRNYLSDIGNYFEFVNKNSLASSIYDLISLSAYLKTISSDQNYSRYLSSLSKFFQFSLDQGLTKTNPLKAALRDKKPSFDEIINQYSEYLKKKNFSESTVRNYLNDIRQFVDWSQQTNSNLQNPNNQ